MLISNNLEMLYWLSYTRRFFVGLIKGYCRRLRLSINRMGDGETPAMLVISLIPAAQFRYFLSEIS
jgi:hypothetical protein